MFYLFSVITWNEKKILLASNPEPGKFWLNVKLIQSQSEEYV